MAGQPLYRLGNEDHPVVGLARQPRRLIHHLACDHRHCLVAFASITGKDIAATEPQAKSEGRAAVRLTKQIHSFTHAQGGTNGPLSVVLVGGRYAEGPDEGIMGQAMHPAPVVGDLGSQCRDVLFHYLSSFLRLDVSKEGFQTDQLGH